MTDNNFTKPDPETDKDLCPLMVSCYQELGLETQHCGPNYDKPPTWKLCGKYRRRAKKWGLA